MADRLPKFIDPRSFAERRRELSGNIKLSSLPRLTADRVDNQGTVAIEMYFDMDGKIARISGRIDAVLSLTCRNCLQTIAWPVNSEFTLAVVSTLDEIELLPEDYEPLLLEENTIVLNDIIEDELLLSVPAFPRHQTDCQGLKQAGPVLNKETETTNLDNPFAVLAKLKNTGD